jgi:hypothetical protein
MDPKLSGFENIPPEILAALGKQGGPGTQGNSQFPFDPQKIQRRVRLILILVFAAVFLFIGLLGSLVFFPSNFSVFFEMFDPGPIKGDLLDLTYVPAPTKSGTAPANGKVWIVTNPSFNYIQTVSTPGSYSVSSECAGCKIRVYIFDPQTRTVQTQWDIPLKGRPYDVELYRQGNAVWMTARQTDDIDPFIYKYDAQTGAELLNTVSFAGEFKELTAPIVELSQFKNPQRYNLKLADGKEFIFTPDDNKLYANQQEFDQSRSGEKEITVFALVNESSDQRRKLFTITGPQNKVLEGRCDAHAGNADTLKFFCGATSKSLSEEVFLESRLIYQDNQLAVIFHQDSLGRDAKRSLTAYGADGKKLWTVPQERLFEEIKYDPEDSLSGIFFMESHLSAERDGDVFVFIVDGVGAIGMNAVSGAELWRIKT